MSWPCVNCGEQNTLGDCCPECAARDCDRCGIKIPMDDEITPNDVFPDWGRDEFSDGAYNVCNECLTDQESKLYALHNGDISSFTLKTMRN